MARISKEEQELVKKKIISVSRELFNNIGFDKTSTKMISKEAGIAEGTIFNYFSTKDEIFFEVFYKDYIDDVENSIHIKSVGNDIVDETYFRIFSVLSKMMRLPKKALIEMSIVTIKIAKKKPDFFKKMAKIDFKYMKEVQQYFDQLILDNRLSNFNTKIISEIIFGSIIYEISIYLYDKDLSENDFKNNLKEKIQTILSCYIIGGK